MSSAIQSFSPSHSGMAIRYDRQPARRAGDVGFEQPRELDQRLLVEADVIDLRRRDARLAQAVRDRLASGNAASCFLRVKRSSCAAATMRPSSTRQAAESW